MWSADDIQQGLQWKDRIARLASAPVVMDTVAPTTMPDLMAANAGLIPPTMYGSSYTHNVRHITPGLAQVIADNLAKMPTDLGVMLSVHQLRGPSTQRQQEDSVFAAREPHFMLEILGFATTSEGREESEKWASALADQVKWDGEGKGNLLSVAYISLDRLDETSLDRLFGPYVQDVLALKKKFDPKNVFKNSPLPSRHWHEAML